MSDTPRGEGPSSGPAVGHDPRSEPDEDITAVSPIPAADDEPTTRTSPRPGPARDELARTPVPYAPAQLPAPPPGQAPQPYPQPGYPQGYAPAPAPLPTTGYVPTHAYDPPPTYDRPSYAPPSYAPPPYAPPPEPPPYPAAPPPAPADYKPPVITPPQPPRMDGVAVASIICSVLGIPLLVVACMGVPFCISGIVMGFVARHRIALAEGKLSGEGVALAAIIVGAVGLAFFVLLLASFLVTPSRSF